MHFSYSESCLRRQQHIGRSPYNKLSLSPLLFNFNPLSTCWSMDSRFVIWALCTYLVHRFMLLQYNVNYYSLPLRVSCLGYGSRTAPFCVHSSGLLRSIQHFVVHLAYFAWYDTLWFIWPHIAVYPALFFAHLAYLCTSYLLPSIWHSFFSLHFMYFANFTILPTSLPIIGCFCLLQFAAHTYPSAFAHPSIFILVSFLFVRPLVCAWCLFELIVLFILCEEEHT
jgi:hypothetical protein